MTTLEYLASDGALRYAIRDRLKTRFSDEELLIHLNEALRKVARDTRYYRGFSIIQVTAYKTNYVLDYRILKVLSAYTEGCRLDIRGATIECEKTSENTLEYITPSYETRSISVYPTLTDPLYEPIDFDKIVVENDLDGIDDLGIPLYIDDNGNVSPIVGVSADYKEVVLYTEYFPVLTIDGNVPDPVLDTAELVNVAAAHIITANSSIRQTQYLHSQTHDRYTILVKEFKRLANSRHVQAEYPPVYRSPFSRKKHSKRKDF